MIAVIFEVWPREGHRQEYLDLAAALRPLLQEIDGFLSIERFESLAPPRPAAGRSSSPTTCCGWRRCCATTA